MSRYLQFKNWKTGEASNAVDVSGRSEREIERIERGMLMNCDVEGGWFVDDCETPTASAAGARSAKTEGLGPKDARAARAAGDAQGGQP